MPKKSHTTKPRAVRVKKSAPVKKRLTTREKIRLLLEAGKKPNDTHFDLARQALNSIINPDVRTTLSGDDFALFLASVSLSTVAVPGYATLDKDHVRKIRALVGQIKEYIEDVSNRRPLNFLMLAAPGAGKSHFINCVAELLRSDGVRAIKFDMTSLEKNEDLTEPLDKARDRKVEDKFPLLFLDEFDSRQEHISLLLPLLWEGEITLGQKYYKLGRAVIVLAGSNPELPKIMINARGMAGEVVVPDGTNPKIVDLLSRINGTVVQIPAFSDTNSSGVDRQLDKVCVAVELLKHRFGPQLRTVPFALLLYIVHTEFRYGVRSIAHLIQLSRCKEDAVVHLNLKNISTPMDDVETLKDSSLIYHLLSKDQVGGVYSAVKAWNAAREIEQQVPVNTKLPFDPWISLWGKSDRVEKFIDMVQEEMKV